MFNNLKFTWESIKLKSSTWSFDEDNLLFIAKSSLQPIIKAMDRHQRRALLKEHPISSFYQTFPIGNSCTNNDRLRSLMRVHRKIMLLQRKVAYLESLNTPYSPIQLNWSPRLLSPCYPKIPTAIIELLAVPYFLLVKETSRSSSHSPQFFSTPKPYKHNYSNYITDISFN